MNRLAPLLLLGAATGFLPAAAYLRAHTGAPSKRSVSSFPGRMPRMSTADSKGDSGSSAIHNSVLGASAFLGSLETGYLTAVRLTNNEVYSGICAASGQATGCGEVLAGPYSVLPYTGIPLAAIAFAGYSAIFVWSSLKSSSNMATGGTAVLALSTAMATFSVYLMMVLALVIHSPCTYCYISAALSVSMAVNAFYGKNIVSSKTKALVVSASSAGIAAFASAFLFYATDVQAKERGSAGEVAAAVAALKSMEAERASEVASKRPPVLTQHSTPEALEVAARLKSLDAKMYGAYWCSHCFNQKQQLGIEAYEKGLFTYVECDKDGFESQYAMCRTGKIPGYPTWEIGGQFFPGEKSLSELSKLLKQFD